MGRLALNIPSLGHRLLPCLGIELPFPWLWALYKGTDLAMKLAQATAALALVYHALALSPPTRITRPFPPTGV